MKVIFLRQEVTIEKGSCSECDFRYNCGYGFRAFEECEINGSKECYKKVKKDGEE